MTELEQLQQKHREEAALKRAKIKERKQRTRRLIERGAMFENVLHEIYPEESLSNEQIYSLFQFAILSPQSIEYIMGIRGQSLSYLKDKGALIPLRGVRPLAALRENQTFPMPTT